MPDPQYARLHVTTSGNPDPRDAVLQLIFRENDDSEEVTRSETNVLRALNALDDEGWALDITRTETPSLGDTYLYFAKVDD